MSLSRPPAMLRTGEVPPIQLPRLRTTRYVLVAGVDLGTSFTKVVIREQAQRVAQVVSFPGDQWLLPSIIGYCDGELQGPCTSPLREPLPYLKMLLPAIIEGQAGSQDSAPAWVRSAMGAAPVEDGRNLLTWYLANVLSATSLFIRRESRWRDFDFTGERLRDKLIAQICVPVGYMRSGECVRCFHEALALGLALAHTVCPSMSGTCEVREWRAMCAAAASKTKEMCKTCCFTYPEVAAGIQGVIRSPVAEDGLYLTVDVGAGTVDMNAFRRHTAQGWLDVSERPNRLDCYGSEVRPLGVMRIREYATGNPFRDYPHVKWNADCRAPLDLLPEGDVMNAVRSQLRAVFSKAIRREGQPNFGVYPGQRTWDECRVFAWGGGYNHAAYDQAVRNGLAERIYPVSVQRLPMPTDLILPPKADYQRLSVAYGLSFLAINLPDITQPGDLDPISILPSRPTVWGMCTLPNDPG